MRVSKTVSVLFFALTACAAVAPAQLTSTGSDVDGSNRGTDRRGSIRQFTAPAFIPQLGGRPANAIDFKIAPYFSDRIIYQSGRYDRRVGWSLGFRSDGYTGAYYY